MTDRANSNSFTTKDWMNSTKDIPVFAYNPAEIQIKPSCAAGTFPQADFELATKKASRPVAVSPAAAKRK